MNHSPTHQRFEPQHSQFSSGSANQYLESSVKNASPAKLRLMLLDRAVELARSVSESWRENPAAAGPSEQTLTLLDFVSELLSGVTSDESPVCHQVADLYVFLAQHLVAAETSGDPTAIDEIRLVLETEAETWRMVVANEFPATKRVPGTTAAPVSGGLNLQA